KPDRDLTAPLSESNVKPPTKVGITLYYPVQLPKTGESELYLAVAEVKDGSSGNAGIARLQQAILKYTPAAPEFYLELARAYAKAGNSEQAIHWCEEALRRKPGDAAAAKDLAESLLRENRAAQADTILRQAVAKSPSDVQLIADLGNTSFREGRIDEARKEYLQALEVNPS